MLSPLFILKFLSAGHREVIRELIDISNAHSFDVTSSNVQPEVSKLSTLTLQLEMNTRNPGGFLAVTLQVFTFAQAYNPVQ